MIALSPKDLAAAALAVLLFNAALLIADRTIAGLVQCEAAGACPNQEPGR